VKKIKSHGLRQEVKRNIKKKARSEKKNLKFFISPGAGARSEKKKSFFSKLGISCIICPDWLRAQRIELARELHAE